MGVVANSRWNLAAFGFNLGAQFVTVPFVIDQIGLAAFGLSGLVLAVCAPFALIGTVLGQALTREMADAWTHDDPRGAARLADTAVWLCMAGCILGVPLLILLGPAVLDLLAQSQQHAQEAWLLFAASVLGWSAQQFGFVFQGMAAARQQYVLIARASAWSALLTVLAIVAITAAHPTTAGYLLAVSVGYAATALMVSVAVAGPAGIVRLTLRPDRGAAKRLLKFGKWQAVSQLAGTFGNQIDRYVLGALAPVSVVGQYNAANRLQEAAYAGVMKGSEVLFPRFGAMGKSEASERAQYFLIASWVVMVFSATALTPLIPLSDSLLNLWVGPEVADGGAFIMKTLVLGGLIGAGTNVFTYYTLGSGRPADIARISMTYAVVTIAASLLLLTLLGPMAAGAGLAVASVFRLAASLLLAHRGLFAGSGLAALLQSTLVPMTIGIGLAYGLLLVDLPAVTSWGQVAGQYTAIAGAVLVLCTGSLGLSRVGRKLFADLRRAGRPSLPPGA